MNMMANIPIKCANYAKSHAVHFNKEVRQELIKKTQVRERDSSTLKQTLSLIFFGKETGPQLSATRSLLHHFNLTILCNIKPVPLPPSSLRKWLQQLRLQ
jgi:hypothetical protein